MQRIDHKLGSDEVVLSSSSSPNSIDTKTKYSLLDPSCFRISKVLAVIHDQWMDHPTDHKTFSEWFVNESPIWSKVPLEVWDCLYPYFQHCAGRESYAYYCFGCFNFHKAELNQFTQDLSSQWGQNPDLIYQVLLLCNYLDIGGLYFYCCFSIILCLRGMKIDRIEPFMFGKKDIEPTNSSILLEDHLLARDKLEGDRIESLIKESKPIVYAEFTDWWPNSSLKRGDEFFEVSPFGLMFTWPPNKLHLLKHYDLDYVVFQDRIIAWFGPQMVSKSTVFITNDEIQPLRENYWRCGGDKEKLKESLAKLVKRSDPSNGAKTKEIGTKQNLIWNEYARLFMKHYCEHPLFDPNVLNVSIHREYKQSGGMSLTYLYDVFFTAPRNPYIVK
jgi:hypothetical protein